MVAYAGDTAKWECESKWNEGEEKEREVKEEKKEEEGKEEEEEEG